MASQLRGVSILCIVIRISTTTSTDHRFDSNVGNSIRQNEGNQLISPEIITNNGPGPTLEQNLLKKPSSKRRKNRKTSIERYRQSERKALKEKFGGDLGNCLCKHESTLVKEQFLQNEFPEFLPQTNTVKESKRLETEELLRSFGGGLDTSLMRHESLLERDKRLAAEQESPTEPVIPLQKSIRLQSELNLMDKFGGELGSILLKHECGLERDIRLAKESAAANPRSSDSSQEYSSCYSEENYSDSEYSPPRANAPRARASLTSPLHSTEELVLEHSVEHKSSLEREKDAKYRQGLSEEEEYDGAAADDGSWCAPAPRI